MPAKPSVNVQKELQTLIEKTFARLGEHPGDGREDMATTYLRLLQTMQAQGVILDLSNCSDGQCSGTPADYLARNIYRHFSSEAEGFGAIGSEEPMEGQDNHNFMRAYLEQHALPLGMRKDALFTVPRALYPAYKQLRPHTQAERAAIMSGFDNIMSIGGSGEEKKLLSVLADNSPLGLASLLNGMFGRTLQVCASYPGRGANWEKEATIAQPDMPQRMEIGRLFGSLKGAVPDFSRSAAAR